MHTSRYHRARAAFFLAVWLSLAASPPDARAQAPARQEVRAVWITTILGLDWPKSRDVAEQQRSLRQMVQELARARYNTIYFQVRGRGDAMYRSVFEPWAESLTGALGRDPGWDPLEFLLREAHASGMEVHAWFNAYLVRTGPDRTPGGSPVHVVDRHPEWVRQANGEWWLDPGLPAVREYLLRVGLDIVRNYDIDGLQFDFIRYPAAPFGDGATYRRYGRGMSKEDWRRENITRFIAAFHDSATAVKPALKLGAAPLGVYRNNGDTRGLQSYDDVYQDSRAWLARGYLDYLAPQVYWSLGDRPGNPDFARVAREWAAHAYGRQIVLGIAAYKPEVAVDLGKIIDITRAAGAAGHAFFRYANVAGLDAVTGRHTGLVNVPAMAWKDALAPDALPGFQVARGAGGVARISWERPREADAAAGPVWVNIYKSAPGVVGRNAPRELLAVRPIGAGVYVDTSARGASRPFAYALCALDRAGNQSPLAFETPLLAQAGLAALGARLSARSALGETVRDAREQILFVPYEVGASGAVAITILDERDQAVGAVVNDLVDAGRYVAAATVGGYRKGWYTLVMTAGSYRGERRFLLE